MLDPGLFEISQVLADRIRRSLEPGLDLRRLLGGEAVEGRLDRRDEPGEGRRERVLLRGHGDRVVDHEQQVELGGRDLLGGRVVVAADAGERVRVDAPSATGAACGSAVAAVSVSLGAQAEITANDRLIKTTANNFQFANFILQFLSAVQDNARRTFSTL